MAKAKYALENGVALITLSDPATLNAISVEMTDELTTLFARACEEARCIVLTGEGRGFSSGANLASGAPPIADDGQPDLGARLELTFNPFVTLLRDLPIPYVTAVNGAAAGIGCSFALLGDLIIAGESAYFLQAFRRIGLVPDGSATYHLPRMIGRVRAMEMMLLGEKIPANTALEWGLVNRCVPDAELLPTAKALALELANGPTKTLGMIRRLAWSSLDNNWEEQVHAERAAQKIAGRTEDFREGVQAFFQKRPANFKGS
ncbi:enoyl-CoA hydratase/isomerase [Candidatus Viadribacter manganicus]|uniref:Enoyl-CoA hydratase n=1 Tax=Candidatus Viadribacter manganicus TaxID=1759059 RepID=A0A1B1ACZ5_9PROT|nr:enoyl-CoA hydratase/isomerase [Candidatus Viadribacter manganicus]ANP44427.1 enoyl-CoA hydratase [Candidatus Viadribacter manganicus]